MINQQSLTAVQEVIATEIDDILTHLGAGDMNSVAYDTAWIARLAPDFSGHGFDSALKWLRRHQHTDGSWGAQQLHHHDRAICTLAAIIALRVVGQGYEDEKRVRRGENYLWRVNGKLHFDANDTVGFPVLAVSLINEALSHGLDVPHDLYHDAATIEKKLNLLSQDPKLWRYTTMVFSLEAVRTYLPDQPSFLEPNGSVGTSPAATAATIMHTQSWDKVALNYLQDVVQPDGGVADAAPIDTFEIAWSLYQLQLAGAIMPDQPEVRRLLDFLWKAWSPQKGLSFSSYFPVQDLDCTATGFSMLRWGGYPVNPDVFGRYEEEDHFRCYPSEVDSSLSAHIRTLAALRPINNGAKLEAWINKIMAVLRRRQMSGNFWFDKWHISPYYSACIAVHALHGIGNDLIKPLVKWIKQTQNPDGGWGFYSQSTAEETAYCLQALLFWDRTVESVQPSQLDAAAEYLTKRLHERHLAAMWIAKCNYSPPHIVRSAILAALYSYLTH